MRAEDKFYTLSVIFMVFFTAIFIGVEFFNIDMFMVGFILFGIPVIVTSAVFWYDLIDTFLKS